MAAPTLVSRVHTTPCDPGFSSGPFVSGAFDAIAGNLIVVLAAQDSYGTRPITTCTDTAGNTYTKATFVATTGTRGIACWYCLSSAAKTGNVVTLTNTGGSLNEKGCSVLQFNASGTWSHVGGSGYTAGAYNGTATTATLNMTGAGVVAEFGTGDEDQTSSTWNFSAGCSNYYGSSSSPDDTGEGSGVVGADLLSAASASHTFTATFANTHSLLGQWGFVAASASGAIAGTANMAVSGSGTLAGMGALAGVAALALAAAAVITGTGALSGNAGMAFATAGTAQASGALSGNAPLAVGAGGTLAGSGALAGNASLAVSATGTATGPSGSISGTAPLAFSTTGTLTGSGKLAGSAPLAVAASGALRGNGALVGTAPFTFTATARPNGSSALAGNANMAFGSTGTLTGLAPIAGTANVVFAATATPAGSSALSGAANLAFTSTGALTGTGLLSGTSGIAFTAQGTPSATAAMGGTAGLTFTATGTLTNGLPSYPADAWYYIQLPARCFYAPSPARSFYALSNPNMTTTFSSKDPGDVIVFTLDATAELAEGETLTAITETDVTMAWNTDPDPAAVVSNPQINGAPVTIIKPNGQTVTIAAGQCVQAIGTGGLNACGYHIAITCTRSISPQVLVLKGILPVSSQ